MSRQLCVGASRELFVDRHPADGRYQCPCCSLRLVVAFTQHRAKLGVIIPAHVAVGEPQPDKIDWSTVGKES